MDCQETQTWIPAWIDGELDPADRVAVATHVESCPNCRAHADALRLLDADLRRAFRPQRDAAERAADRVLATLHSQRRVRGATAARLRFWASLLVATAAGFVLALICFPPTRRDPQQSGREAIDPVIVQPDIAPGEPSIARMVVSTGDVEVRGGGESEWQSVSLPDQFHCTVGTEIRTKTGIRCELETVDGCAIRLNERAELAVRSPREVELRAGQIWCSSPADVSLRVVATAESNAASPTNVSPWSCVCPSNAALLTEVGDSGELRVITASGEIDIATPLERQRLKQGQMAKFVDGRLVIEAHRADALLATSWMHTLLTRKGYASDELTDRVDRLLANIGQSKIANLYEEEIRSLGEYCVLPLLRFVQSPMSREALDRRLTAMRILADVAPTWSVPELIELLADDDPRVRILAATALARLTGHTHGRLPQDWNAPLSECEASYAAWKQWWQSSHHRYPRPVTATPVMKKA